MSESEKNDAKAAKCGIFVNIFAIYGWLSWLHVDHTVAIVCWVAAGFNVIGVIVFNTKAKS